MWITECDRSSKTQCRGKVGVPLLNLGVRRGVGLPFADFLKYRMHRGGFLSSAVKT